MPEPVNLQAWIAERRSAPWLTIDVGDGDPIQVADPIVWPEVPDDNEQAMGTILGDGLERFKAAGGTWQILNALITERAGLNLGE